jgi:hypothetical protein
MREIINRTGEINYNTFGSKMIIIEYRGALDIDVYFPEYDWIVKNIRYSVFKNGNIKCPFDKSVFGVGYLGEGKYKCKENGKTTRVYKTWYGMIRRCYDSKCQKRQPTYIDCEVSNEWHNFQNFAKWYDKNYYEIEDERMCLDKDILHKNNKVYSPNTCIFVPQTINSLFIKNNKNRGESAIGTSLCKNDKYRVDCCLINPETGKFKGEYLGIYDTQEEAFEIYKYYKEHNIKQVADYYKEQIPERLYNGMYDYIVEIND